MLDDKKWARWIARRFEIDGNGVMSVRKYGHEIIRAPDNRVWVDGVQRN